MDEDARRCLSVPLSLSEKDLLSRLQVASRQYIGGELVQLDVETGGSNGNRGGAVAGRHHILHHGTVVRNARRCAIGRDLGSLRGVATRKGLPRTRTPGRVGARPIPSLAEPATQR